ncbi:MAG: LytR C-terminal domain-containing protein [Pseudonocardiales bacterium]|nr:LytR C-terminal domain-containing protein [Pseudonocardiales bacterium]
MGTPNGTEASRRLRRAGWALLSFAVLALLIGFTTPLTHVARAMATGQPPGTPIHAPTSTPVRPSVIAYPPPAPSRPAEGSAIPLPGPSEAAQGAPAGDQGPNGNGSSAKTPSANGPSRGEVRVYNNGTVRGLAGRAARDLTAAGWTVVEIGNYARGRIPTTTAYYQEGTDQLAAAQALGAQFGMRVEPRFPGIAGVGPGLVVIITNDYASR